MKISEIKHFSHGHMLVLSSFQAPFQCDGCKELGIGSCYQCKKSCNFHLHRECALNPPSTSHPFFKKRNFEFHKKRKRMRSCVACGKDVQGFMYKSKRDNLHPCCLKLQNTLNGGGVMLNLREEAPSKCLMCQSKKIARGLKGWAYVSSCGKHCYHVGCIKDMILENRKRDEKKISLELTGVQQNGESSSSGDKKKKDGKGWKITKYILDMLVAVMLGDVVGLTSSILQPLLSSN